MISVVLAHPADWDGFRAGVRSLVSNGIDPGDVAWSVGENTDLFGDTAPPPAVGATFTVPRALADLAETVIQARDPARFGLLHTLIHRAQRGERAILDQVTDPDVHRATRLAQSVRRDTHKMRAFLRCRAVEEAGETRYVGWFEPAHFIVDANAAFFVRRFATMTWSILTPDRSAHWDGAELTLAPGAPLSELPADDAIEVFWRTYFASIFNPARLKVSAMTSEMPKKYWRNLPEAALIPELIRSAGVRTQAMVDQTPAPDTARPRAPATPVIQAATSLDRAAAEAAECRRCPLWEPATQTVFGEGPPDAAMMLVGEQPGDQEDLAGRPFVGPAGQILDRALTEAGIDRRSLYVTNAVKHFKFVPRGKRRIHAKPETPEIVACRFWLDIERAEVAPKLVVALGATAARAVLNRVVTIGRERGRAIPLDGGQTGFVTVHPSYLLRLPDQDSRAREYAAFVTDLRAAAQLVSA